MKALVPKYDPLTDVEKSKLTALLSRADKFFPSNGEDYQQVEAFNNDTSNLRKAYEYAVYLWHHSGSFDKSHQHIEIMYKALQISSRLLSKIQWNTSDYPSFNQYWYFSIAMMLEKYATKKTWREFTHCYDAYSFNSKDA